MATAIALGGGVARAADPLVVEIAAKGGFIAGEGIIRGALGGRFGASYYGFYGRVGVVDYPATGTSPQSLIVLEGELGYGFTISLLTIRPYLGLGGYALTGSSGCTSACEGPPPAFALQPGVLAQLAFGHLIVGVAGSALVTLGGTFGQLDVQAGARF